MVEHAVDIASADKVRAVQEAERSRNSEPIIYPRTSGNVGNTETLRHTAPAS